MNMSDIVATVNGQPIRKMDLDNTIQGFCLEQYRKTADQLTPTEKSELQELAVEKLLARELIFQEAMTFGIVAEESAIDAERQKIVANFPSEDEFFSTLEKAGIDAMMYHRMLRQDITVNMMTDKKLEELPEPTEDQINAMYEERSKQMVRKGRVRASHILVKAEGEDKSSALETIQSLKDQSIEDDFAALAKSHSACPSSTGGGDLGWFRKGDMVKSFEEAAFSQELGVVGDPVETQFGYHLIKVTEREKNSPLTLEEARPQIVNVIKGEAGSKLIAEWVEELKRRAVIDFVDA
jgi:peptidyl-prolyl cis-trans isomerase C